jgi:Xaa-Pro aminopeptidase
MLQTFETVGAPQHGAARLAALRVQIAAQGLAGFIVPRADVHQGEYVAARDARLEWLTGFSGSAGFCVVLAEAAGVFVDGRYRTAVLGQVDLSCFTPVPWPEVQAGPWILQHISAGRIGFDPWLHTRDEIAALQAALAGSGVSIEPCANLVDLIWTDRPAGPMGRAFVHPFEFAGQSSAEKRAALAADLRAVQHRGAVITLPDSLCWLLNIRGSDVPRNPVVQGFAILHDDGCVDLFCEAGKLGGAVLAALGPEVTLRRPEDFSRALADLAGPIRLDPSSAPYALGQILGERAAFADDPTRLPKARKNAAELSGMRAAHLRDGAAMVEFLAWAEEATRDPTLSEIDITRALEGFRAATGALHDISFETICGAGPNGAIIHYRVSQQSNRAIGQSGLLLVDSGGQYLDGTTDVTRTLPIGAPQPEHIACYTRVLAGLIAISRARWPVGLAGRDLDALARAALWMAGQDYDHGTGHGVGAFLSVHEGPQRISRASHVPLEIGMIVSNEPGYYRAGEFGIRLENLIAVQAAPQIAGGDAGRAQLCFETLTVVPFDRRLIDAGALSRGDVAWLNSYHEGVFAALEGSLSARARAWCEAACAPL